jgi:uncharacterized surface anchored protein
VTSSNGSYIFSNLEPADYVVIETNPLGYKTDIKDGDESIDGDPKDGESIPDNKISVTLKPSEEDKDNNFVDSNKGSISGKVEGDEGSPLSDVLLKLLTGSIVIATTKTGTDGSYKFSGVSPGDYAVVEINPSEYPSNVRDGDTVSDGDSEDSDTTPDNSIKVTLTPSEDDTGNDFVDSNDGSITGTVKDDNGSPIPGVILTLEDSGGNLITTRIAAYEKTLL